MVDGYGAPRIERRVVLENNMVVDVDQARLVGMCARCGGRRDAPDIGCADHACSVDLGGSGEQQVVLCQSLGEHIT